jgi:hypothetical protein
MKNLPGLLIFIFLTGVPALSPAAPTSVAQVRADTLVHTQDEQGQAALKPIASLKLGDMVLAKSEWKAEGENLSYEPITDILVTPAQPRKLVDLVLADGQTITTTDGHPFNTPDGWRDAILLKKGGKLLLKGDGESDRVVEIASVTHRTETQTTYNLEVANAHTFFVGEDGVLVHNEKGGTPGNNQAQNRQFKYACQAIGKKRGEPLNKKEQRQLHDAITGQDMSVDEIIEEGISMFCCDR